MINKFSLKSELLKNILALMSGTLLSQGISIATSPILTRLYSPKDFGVFAIYGAFVSIIAVASTGRYELAIVLPEKDEDSINIIALSVLISLLLSILSLFFVLIFGENILSFFNTYELKYWIYSIPIPIFLTGVYQSFNYWLNRNRKFKDLAKVRFFQSILITIANLYLGFIGLGFNGQILANLLGQFIGTCILIWLFLSIDAEKLKLISIKSIKQNAIKYKDFPKINLLHSFIDILQSSSITLFMGNIFSSHSLGLYSFSRRILKTPMELISNSMTDVYYQKISETFTKGDDLHLLVKNTIIRLCYLFIPIFVILGLFSREIFSFVFGYKWENAGLYAQILIPWILLNAISSPISQVPLIINKQKMGFYFGIVYNVSIVLSLFVTAYLSKDIINSLCAMSFSASIVLIFYIIWILRISKSISKK